MVALGLSLCARVGLLYTYKQDFFLLLDFATNNFKIIN